MKYKYYLLWEERAYASTSIWFQGWHGYTHLRAARADRKALLPNPNRRNVSPVLVAYK